MRKGWKVEKLGDVCEVFADGDWIESKDQSLKGIRLIQTGNVGNGVFKDRITKARYISIDTFKRLRCTEIFEGDCLVSRLPDPVGRACILPNTGERMITAVDCTIIRFDKSQVIPTFFNYYSQSAQYQNYVDRETTGTTRNRISRSKLAEVEIPIPPLPEQRRIVSVLDEAFASIDQAKANAEQNLVNAGELFGSYLESLFADSRNGWEEKKLGEVCERITDGTHITPTYVSEGVPFLSVKNLTKGFIDFSDTRFISPEEHKIITKRVLPQRDDVLYTKVGTTGVAQVVDVDVEFSIFVSIALLKLKHEMIFNKYLEFFLNSPFARKQAQKRTRGTANKNLVITDIKEIEIHFPKSLAEQRAIVGRLEALSAETGRLEEIYQSKVEGLEELKKSVLQRAFSGEL